jgi:hypothetical protein
LTESVSTNLPLLLLPNPRSLDRIWAAIGPKWKDMK